MGPSLRIRNRTSSAGCFRPPAFVLSHLPFLCSGALLRRDQVSHSPYHMVEKELVIHSKPSWRLRYWKMVGQAELHYQKTNDNFTVGDIFLGRIRKLIPA